jgi:hypothetical protein
MEKKQTFIEWLKNIKRKNAKVKNLRKSDVSGQLICDHDWRSGFDNINGSYVWCSKCRERT